MAGVKVTDLTVLSTAAPTDVLYIVDTGANQSKQIEVQNLFSGIVDSGAAGLSIGSTSVSGACYGFTINNWSYIKVDNIVSATLYGVASLDFSLGSLGTADWDITTLPVPASGTIYGLFTINDVKQFTGYIQTNGQFRFGSNDTTLIAGGMPFIATIQYIAA